jgi:hypothetical protein
MAHGARWQSIKKILTLSLEVFEMGLAINTVPVVALSQLTCLDLSLLVHPSLLMTGCRSDLLRNLIYELLFHRLFRNDCPVQICLLHLLQPYLKMKCLHQMNLFPHHLQNLIP